MPDIEHTPEELHELAEKIRTGEYFREARAMYDTSVHDPMAERYFYLFITAISLLILFFANMASGRLYPLKASVPFVYSTNDIVEDYPHMQSLIEYKGESPSDALLSFLTRNYVVSRESYSIDGLDRNISAIKGVSTPEVYEGYQRYLDPHNPDSPITLYQRHTKRIINIVSAKRIFDQDYGMEVLFEAVLEAKDGLKKSQWEANIGFTYSGVALDDKTGKVKPIAFQVTKYNVKRLQDIQ